MKAGYCQCRSLLPYVLAISILGLGVNAYGAEFLWVPISDDMGLCLPPADPGTSTEMVCSEGGVTVRLDLYIGGWDSDLDGDPLLGAWQATVDSASYLGQNAKTHLPSATASIG